ncbi:NAD-dependent protein deacetylase [Egicoccus halophilus]|uniref:protein acetyllysine N-acetyltransferase n=1 Tax=Egicoccus halophilus TaxID=1670830 RepID=A0A8J3AAA3_9ACTN|nr:NAD-dependent protein deacetylase [Egicoccus halophilus]GGI08400.1 NAD-dependent protein deacetylase [Egicoccus halophilus]
MTPAAARQTRSLAALFDAGPLLVVTGAGMSTDSGIPDYRDATGRMRHASPMTFQRFTGSLDERRRYWARSHLGWQRIALARPNACHAAVAELQGAGRLSGIVTQNVDGLHTAAGASDVIDLHGRLDTVVCLDCGRRRPRLELGLRLDAVNPQWRDLLGAGVAVHRPDGDVAIPEHLVADFRVVDCRRCGGTLKPDVVFFGEHVPADRFRRALGCLEASAGLLVLGSSLMVGSGFRFVTAAARRGLPVAIVTRGVTRGDRHATLKIDAPLCDVLPALAATLTGAAMVGPSAG